MQKSILRYCNSGYCNKLSEEQGFKRYNCENYLYFTNPDVNIAIPTNSSLADVAQISIGFPLVKQDNSSLTKEEIKRFKGLEEYLDSKRYSYVGRLSINQTGEKEFTLSKEYGEDMDNVSNLQRILEDCSSESIEDHLAIC